MELTISNNTVTIIDNSGNTNSVDLRLLNFKDYITEYSDDYLILVFNVTTHSTYKIELNTSTKLNGVNFVDLDSFKILVDAAIVSAGLIQTANVADYSITEQKLSLAVQTKINSGKIAGIITTTLPSTGIVTDKVYEFAGVNGGTVTGGTIKDTNGSTITTLQSGDSVWYNTATTFWYRIPFQAIPISKSIDDFTITETGAEIKSYSNIGEVEQYINTNLLSSSINLYNYRNLITGRAIHPITGSNISAVSYDGVGNWVANYFIPINPSTLYGFNHNSDVHWYTKDLVWISGVNEIGGADAAFEATSPSNAKYCRIVLDIRYYLYVYMMVKGGLTAMPTASNFVPYGKYISTNKLIDDNGFAFNINKNNCFYNGNFGLPKTVNAEKVLSAFKDIKLYGNWDTTKLYRIRSFNYNNATVKYELWLTEINTSGVSVAYAYQSGVVDLTVSPTNPTYVTYPLVGGKYIKALIDFSILTSGTSYNIDVNNNFVIRPTNIIPDEVLFNPSVIGDAIEGSDLSLLPASPKDSYSANTIIPIKNTINNKKGMFCYRIDDNGVNEEFDSTLEKYGFRASYSLNVGPNKLNIPYHLQNQRRGHDYGDHSPEHNEDWFTIPTGYEDLFATFVGSGLDSIVGTKAFVTRRFDVGGVDRNTVTNAATELSTLKIGGTAYNLTLGSNEISGDFSSLMAYKYYYLYIDNAIGNKIGWVTISPSTLTNTKAYMTKADLTVINATANETINMYAIPTGGTFGVSVWLEQDAQYVLALAGYLWFSIYGFKPPKYWSAAGGNWAYVKAAPATYAINKLGEKHATVGYGESEILLTYNQYNNDYPLTSQLYIDITVKSYSDLQSVKNTVANLIAKHSVFSLLAHHNMAKISFGTADGYTNAADRKAQYDKFNEAFCSWCYTNNIPLVTLSEMSTIINESTSNPNINVIPNLYTDLAGQLKPDGHTLGTGSTWVLDDGVPEDKLHCLKRTTASSSNPITTITNLGGLEKGKNNVGCWIKGTIGDTITIDWGGIKTSTFIVATTGYNEFTDTLIIPYTTNFITIVIKATVVTSDCRISGIYLHK